MNNAMMTTTERFTNYINRLDVKQETATRIIKDLTEICSKSCTYRVWVTFWTIYNSEDQVRGDSFYVDFDSKHSAAAYVTKRYCSWETYRIDEIGGDAEWAVSDYDPFWDCELAS